MGLELFPRIVTNSKTGKTFRQARFIANYGQWKYRRAQRNMPGLWMTYKQLFMSYPDRYEGRKKASE